MVLGRAYQPPQRRPMDLARHHLETINIMTRKDVKGDQPSGGETTWTNTGATRYGRGQHKTGSFGDDMLRPSPNHGTQRLPNDDDDDESDACHPDAKWLLLLINTRCVEDDWQITVTSSLHSITDAIAVIFLVPIIIDRHYSHNNQHTVIRPYVSQILVIIGPMSVVITVMTKCRCYVVVGWPDMDTERQARGRDC